jgi:hypothetical protein
VYKPVPYQDPASITEEDKRLVAGNHHFIHKQPNQVIIVGDKNKSNVLKKAVLLSSPQDRRNRGNYYPCQSIRQKLGDYHKSLNRSSLRKMPPTVIAESFKEYLDHAGSE